MKGTELTQIRLVSAVDTTLSFGDATFDLSAEPDGIRIAVDEGNYSLLRRVTQHVPYEADVSENHIVDETREGVVDYERYFIVDWEDALSFPQVTFKQPPHAVERRYLHGQSIELGLEEVERYTVHYQDGVEAEFVRDAPDRFEFRFSTGFYGSFWKDPDGSFTIRFRGDLLDPAEDAQRSQSKFVVSRSKYSGNLLLILQEDAAVSVG